LLDCCFQTVHYLCFRQFVAIQVLLQSLIIHLSRAFHKLFPVNFQSICQIVRDRDLAYLALIFVRISLLGNHINIPTKSLRRPYGDLNRNKAARQLLFNFSQYLFKIGIFTIHLVDEDYPGKLGIICHIPDKFGLDLNACNRTNHKQGVIHYPEDTLYVTDKIGKTG